MTVMITGRSYQGVLLAKRVHVAAQPRTVEYAMTFKAYIKQSPANRHSSVTHHI